MEKLLYVRPGVCLRHTKSRQNSCSPCLNLAHKPSCETYGITWRARYTLCAHQGNKQQAAAQPPYTGKELAMADIANCCIFTSESKQILAILVFYLLFHFQYLKFFQLQSMYP